MEHPTNLPLSGQTGSSVSSHSAITQSTFILGRAAQQEPGALWCDRLYIENGMQAGQTADLVAIQADGGLSVLNASIANLSPHIVASAVGTRISSSVFSGFMDDTPHIIINSSAQQTKLDNLMINGGSGQTGDCIDVEAAFCQLSNIYMNTTGRLNVVGIESSVSNIYMYHPAVADSSYAIELSAGSVLTGGFIDGFNGQEASPSVCHGVRAAGSTVTGMRIRRLNAANGIVSTSSADVITGNYCGELNEGTPFIKASGAQFWGNNSDTGTSHLTRIQECLTLPLNTWHNYSNGTYLNASTTPALDINLTNHYEFIQWPAADDTNLKVSFTLPEGFDGTRDITVALFVKTDNTGGGAIDAASFSVYSSWDDGASFTDSATDSSPSETLHTITATIAASDIPDSAHRLTLVLEPDGHVNDPIILTDVHVTITRTITSV